MTGVRRAMVLCAGLGTRLMPVTRDVAKPALPFVSEPILGRLLDGLAEAGVEDVMINLHHAPDSVRAVAASRGSRLPRVHWSDETALLLGTAGALIPVRDWLAELGDPILILNGDVVHALDLKALINAHACSGADATLAVRPRGEPGFQSLGVDEAGHVVSFSVPYAGREHERHFLSVQVVSPRMLEFLPRVPQPLGTFTDWHPAAIRGGRVIATWATEGEWHGIDSRELFVEAVARWLILRGRASHAHPEADVSTSATLLGGACVEARARVASGARLERSVVFPEARIGEDAELTGCLVAPRARVPAGARLRDVIIPAEENAA